MGQADMRDLQRCIEDVRRAGLEDDTGPVAPLHVSAPLGIHRSLLR